ncbi:GNAT family N-acetyltransferase [Asanoa sp. WMMD1127]|uniref:GNAT family N-acetyltransferase n=1 Tax=Asanoa sp. WMMD1127 TaxID=3016107 RepID=UPI0024170384|nr:GNAT family N-acetyltransferase [Asanoa sp. WMMD1127]MDG4823978.1 GNAT family N-acetyltransferase [Asanoa sp. WMMD1127]
MVGVVMRACRGVDDIDGIRALSAAVRQADGDAWLPDDVSAPDPHRAVAADAETGEIVGVTSMEWWDEADGTRLYLLSGCVDPRRRRRGVGAAILRWQEEQAVAFDRDQPSTAAARAFGVNVAPQQTANHALVTAAGYRVAFTVLELTCRPQGDAGALPAGLELRAVETTHHRRIHEAVEECFAASRHGYQARTHEQYLQDVRDVDLWQVAWAGDEVAAVVATELEPDGTATTPWVAVRPPWRRRGVGLALMRHTLRALAGRGVPLARLRTIEENPHNSVGLYERAGYTITDRQPRYRKPLPPR